MRVLEDCSGKRSRNGQTTTEYVIILGLVALGSISVILLFGNQIRALYGAATRKAAGYEGEVNTEAAEASQDAENVDSMVGAFE